METHAGDQHSNQLLLKVSLLSLSNTECSVTEIGIQTAVEVGFYGDAARVVGIFTKLGNADRG